MPVLPDRNFSIMPVLNHVDSYCGLAQDCGLISTPGTPRPRMLSIEGRSVPDYGAPFNFVGLAEINNSSCLALQVLFT